MTHVRGEASSRSPIADSGRALGRALDRALDELGGSNGGVCELPHRWAPGGTSGPGARRSRAGSVTDVVLADGHLEGLEGRGEPGCETHKVSRVYTDGHLEGFGGRGSPRGLE